MPHACPTCGLPSVRLPAVLVSGPPLPDVAECERGHQVELASGGVVPANVAVLGDHLGSPVLTWPVGAPVPSVPWSHPDADVLGAVRRYVERLADEPMLPPPGRPTGQ